ncbi:MAG: MarR family transcriptional regulator [Propionibacteriaceae bacterium]|nr:MarR family transcriptional regulator [Propionibacteriaceae bacterium]
MSTVIDTTEMYLRTIYELLEEGVTPLRARIAERMHHSGPTVSQTVSRMERDGLLAVREDRRILLSAEGEQRAARVIRRHRLAERLLVDVIGLEWPLAHEEACRWEHVIGERVESHLVSLLGDPQESVFGNPIPGLDEPVGDCLTRFLDGAEVLSLVVSSGGPLTVRVVRIGEFLQRDTEALSALHQAGILPGVEVQVTCDPTCLTLMTPSHECSMDADWAEQLFVARC